MLNGDVILRSEDIRKFVSMAHEGALALGVREVENPEDYGVVLVEDGRVVEIFEKVKRPPTTLANVGIYSFTSEVLEAVERTELSPRGEYEITDSLRLLIEEGAFVRAVAVDYWLDVSYPWDLLDANEEVLRGMKGEVLGEVEDNVMLKGEVSIGEGTVVRSGSYIVGPVVIGRNCEIGPNVCIFPATSIGNNVSIEAFTLVRNSVIMDDVSIGAGCSIKDSIIDKGCSIGDRFSTQSGRGDVKINGEHRSVEAGAMLGECCVVGDNVVAKPCTILGNNVKVGDMKVVSGVIPDNSLVW